MNDEIQQFKDSQRRQDQELIEHGKSIAVLERIAQDIEKHMADQTKATHDMQASVAVFISLERRVNDLEGNYKEVDTKVDNINTIIADYKGRILILAGVISIFSTILTAFIISKIT